MNAFNFDELDIESFQRSAEGFCGDHQAALEYIHARVAAFKQLPSVVTLYRAVFLRSIDELKVNNLGHHWVDDIVILGDAAFLDYLQYECFHIVIPGDPYIIKADFPVHRIDFSTTLQQNVLKPQESEFYVSDTQPASGVSVLGPGFSKFVPVAATAEPETGPDCGF